MAIYHDGVECRDGAEWWAREIAKRLFLTRSWESKTTTRVAGNVLTIHQGNRETYRVTVEKEETP